MSSLRSPTASVGGEQHEAFPVGRRQGTEVVDVERADAVGAQAPGERDERGVGEADVRMAARDRDRLHHRVGPPAHGVGAAVQVVPQAAAELRAQGGGEAIHLRDGQRRGDEVVVERVHPVADARVVGVAGAHERHDDRRVEDDRHYR